MSAPVLPHWEETPADLPGAVREIKAAIRARIAASGRTVEEVFAVVEQRLEAEVADVRGALERGETVWPVIDYADIAAGAVTAEQLAYLRGQVTKSRWFRLGRRLGLGPDLSP